MHPTPLTAHQDHLSWRELVDAWRTASLGSGWRHSDDWDLAPVERIARQLLRDARLSPELSASLGSARALAGAGAREILLDLKALYSAVGQELDLDIAACALDAWAETSHDTADLGCIDVTTGLHTPAHFRQRVRELLREQETEGTVLVTSFGLRHDRPDASRPLNWTLLAELGDCVSQALGQGSCAAHFPGTVAVAFRDGEDSMRRIQDCQLALETLRGGTLLPIVATQEKASRSRFAGLPEKLSEKSPASRHDPVVEPTY